MYIHTQTHVQALGAPRNTLSSRQSPAKKNPKYPLEKDGDAFPHLGLQRGCSCSPWSTVQTQLVLFVTAEVPSLMSSLTAHTGTSTLTLPG